jgi:hypothetical protein
LKIRRPPATVPPAGTTVAVPPPRDRLAAIARHENCPACASGRRDPGTSPSRITETPRPWPKYERRNPEDGVLDKVLQPHLETFLKQAAESHDGAGLPRFVEKELRAFLKCGVLAHGFCRFVCADCRLERLAHA